jgi:DNA-directed RNA polymerase specialized sigma24 family protein
MYNAEFIARTIRVYHGDHCLEDVRQDLFEILLKIPPGDLKAKQDKGELKAYICRIIINLKKQKYGKIAKKISLYKSFDELPKNLELMPEPEPEPDVNAVLQKIHWYYAGLLRLYCELGTLKAVSEKTKIPLQSVKHAIRQAKIEAKKLW